jgi:hypothetical protein
MAVAEAAQSRGVAVAILIDEIQYFGEKELSALIMSMHRMQQRQLPLILLGAGLPILPRLAGESKSYAERLFAFPPIGPLEPEYARKALQDPVSTLGVRYEIDALEEMVTLTQGYPYFLQEWGYQTWSQAESSPITLDVVRGARPAITQRLDENFFRVRFDRLTPAEKLFLRGMAELGNQACRIGDLAELLQVKVGSLSPRRAALIHKGMIYSPSHGDLDFTVPLFGEFMRRQIPDFPPK